jgi:hypothetical protein
MNPPGLRTLADREEALGRWDMMITVSELEAIIAQTPPGEQVQYETKLIGSVDNRQGS